MRRKLPTHKRDDDDDLRSADDAVAYLRRRWHYLCSRSHNTLPRIAVLLCLALLLALSLWWQRASLTRMLHHHDPPRAHTATAVLLDGRSIAKPLPRAYPNGVTGLHRCDLPSLRYQCDLSASVGCKAYPQLFSMGELLRNWSPEEPEKQPERIFESICRFNVSIPVCRRCTVW